MPTTCGKSQNGGYISMGKSWSKSYSRKRPVKKNRKTKKQMKNKKPKNKTVSSYY